MSGCPCLYTTPCSDRCTCANPVSSSGCQRCASYGSPEQQKAAAERLAKVDALCEYYRTTCDVLRSHCSLPQWQRQQVVGGWWLYFDDYEVANLKAAVMAGLGHGVGTGLVPLGASPLNVLNNGDWIGQIFYKLPDVAHAPNRSAAQLVDDANKRS